MTPRKFFVGRTVGFFVLVIIALGIYIYKTYINPRLDNTTPITNDSEVIKTKEPVFSWRYEIDDSLNGDGLPQTNVYLDVSYSNRKIDKLIATVPGGCNDLPDKEKDSAPNSVVAQCYAAGYGDLFKIIKGSNAYLVMRKVFEEASPDYNPKPQEYEVVYEVPLI